MYSTKVLGNSASYTVDTHHSHHKAALKHAVKNKKHLPHGKKKV